MFTGLIRDTGRIVTSRPRSGGRVIEVLCERSETPNPGESISVNGVCLTVERVRGKKLTFSVSPETLACSHDSKWRQGTIVNLEPALRLSDRLDGHLVQGHVDGTGEVKSFRKGEFWILVVKIPEEVVKYVVPKGSMAVDGISLTVAELIGNEASFALIPKTVEATSIKSMEPGSFLHLEADIVAKYVERLLPHADL